MRNSPASRPSATSSSTWAASFRRQPSTPARSAAVSSRAVARTSSASSRRASSAAGSRFGKRPLPLEQVVRDGAPAGLLLDEMGAREHEAAVQRGEAAIDVRLRRADDPAQLRRRSAVRRSGSPRRARARARSARPGRAARRVPAACAERHTPSPARRACRRRRGRAPAARPSLPRARPISSDQRTNVPSGSRTAKGASAVPATCSQSEGRTTSASGRGGRSRPRRSSRLRPPSVSITRLQACPR